MSGRLPSGVLVSALLRRVNDAGGFGAVMAKGDAQGGAILVIAVDKGAPPRLLERGIGPYWRRRRARDPDLWVIEVDIAAAERFAAETILDD
jgi:hypothetical protein